MDRYRKAGVALLGALAQLATVLDEAQVAGVLPHAWLPWVRVVLALATALGVWAVPNVPMPALLPEHGRDRGTSTLMVSTVMAVLLVAAATWLLIALAIAPPASAHRSVEHVRASSARVCGHLLLVGVELEQRHGREWVFAQDDGLATVQLRYLGNGAGPGGHWETIASVSGGEGLHRVDVGGRPYWDAVRVVHAGVASSPHLAEGCTP